MFSQLKKALAEQKALTKQLMEKTNVEEESEGEEMEELIEGGEGGEGGENEAAVFEVILGTPSSCKTALSTCFTKI